MLREALSETPGKLFLLPPVSDSAPEEIEVKKPLDNTPQPYVFELREGVPYIVFLGEESGLMQEFHRLTDKANERSKAVEGAKTVESIISFLQ